MPTYAYRCPGCGHEFEKFHKMTVTDSPACPECGAGAERMITGGAGLLFKGSGFYITDYKKPGSKDGKAVEGGEPAKTSGKDAAAKGTTGPAEKKAPSPKPKPSGD